jgi:hypothetical protein
MGHDLVARTAKDRFLIVPRPRILTAGEREPARRLPSGASVTRVPLALVLLHIGPGVVVDIALLVVEASVNGCSFMLAVMCTPLHAESRFEPLPPRLRHLRRARWAGS